MTLSTVVQLSY